MNDIYTCTWMYIHTLHIYYSYFVRGLHFDCVYALTISLLSGNIYPAASRLSVLPGIPKVFLVFIVTVYTHPLYLLLRQHLPSCLAPICVTRDPKSFFGFHCDCVYAPTLSLVTATSTQLPQAYRCFPRSQKLPLRLQASSGSSLRTHTVTHMYACVNIHTLMHTYARAAHTRRYAHANVCM